MGLNLRREEVGCWIGSGHTDHLDTDLGGESTAVCVVDVDHTQPATLGAEERSLDPEVLVHVRMEVEVVRGKIREDAGTQICAINPAVRQTVTLGLERHGIDTLVAK